MNLIGSQRLLDAPATKQLSMMQYGRDSGCEEFRNRQAEDTWP